MAACSRENPPTARTVPSLTSSGLAISNRTEVTPLQLPFENPGRGRLRYPGSGTAFPLSSPNSASWDWPADSADCLQNLALAPEDRENGRDWAWDILRSLPPGERSAFLDQVLTLLPIWAWTELDPILMEPSWGPEVHATLFRRLVETPGPIQWPRLVRIAANPYHPSKPAADALLQSYFPEIQPGNYSAYLSRVQTP